MQEQGPVERVLGAIRRLTASLVESGETRLRLAVLELEEERERLFVLLLLSGIALMLICFGIGMAILLVVAAYWDTHRLLAIALCGGTLLILGGVIAWRVKAIASRRSLLRSTLSHLSTDSESLKGVRAEALARQRQREHN
ncbi:MULTISPECIES: phage holin family protein [Cobetia]|uniref:Phage holin family protein n=1 Tax=Cobetia crustatorum TaxID=553385 RepID=A0A558HJJ3_9GAMM|nr:MULTISPECIES: phage holin family protein [Cobetia]TVU69302.1 hypothetical protein FQP86_12750 [Cobetia crustatorum]